MLGLNFKNAYQRELIGDFLGDISMYEHKKGRPLLSALVIHKSNDKVQGNGFYKLCTEIYKKDWEVLKSDKYFEIERIKECYSFWKDNSNYNKYRSDY
jgi:hypothetical protein